MSRIVLFGANGFVGSHVSMALAPRELYAPTRADVDLLSHSDIRAVLRRGDIVVNAAGYAQATDRTSMGLARLWESNVTAVANIASVGVEIGIAQLIHVSSVAAMGRVRGLGCDEHATGPVASPYAESKREAERILAGFGDRLPITVLRLTSVFGEGRGLATTLCRLARLPILPLPSGGQALIPFTYVRNVADAVALAAGNESTLGETYIVGDAHSYRLRDIVVGLARRLGSDPRIIAVHPRLVATLAGLQRAVPSRAGRPLFDQTRLETLTTSVSYSIDKFREATSYAPRYSLADALERLAEWHMAGTVHGRK